MSEAIVPTVGRVLWFRPNGQTVFTRERCALDDRQAPFLALIAHVFTPSCINIALFSSNGHVIDSPPTSVRLLQPGEEPPAHGQCYCEWMPYQKGKAHGSESGEPAAGTTPLNPDRPDVTSPAPS